MILDNQFSGMEDSIEEGIQALRIGIGKLEDIISLNEFEKTNTPEEIEAIKSEICTLKDLEASFITVKSNIKTFQKRVARAKAKD